MTYGMRNLRLKIQVILDEDGSWSPTLANVSTHRIIDKQLRIAMDDNVLRTIIDKELTMGSMWVSKEILKALKLPLNVDTKELEETIKKELEELFPNFSISLYFNEGKFRIYSFHDKPYTGTTVEIRHPLASDQLLTTRYYGMYDRLEDGTWCYVDQCHDYYEGVLERVPAPLDVDKLMEYCKNKDIEFELPTHRIQPLPAPKPPDEDDGY